MQARFCSRSAARNSVWGQLLSDAVYLPSTQTIPNNRRNSQIYGIFRKETFRSISFLRLRRLHTAYASKESECQLQLRRCEHSVEKQYMPQKEVAEERHISLSNACRPSLLCGPFSRASNRFSNRTKCSASACH